MSTQTLNRILIGLVALSVLLAVCIAGAFLIIGRQPSPQPISASTAAEAGWVVHPNSDKIPMWPAPIVSAGDPTYIDHGRQVEVLEWVSNENGDFCHIKFRGKAGYVEAQYISGTQLPTPTPIPVPTNMPVPTSTPVPTDTPIPTATPSSLTYNDIERNSGIMTDIQWEDYVHDIVGLRVHWKGAVEEVQKDGSIFVDVGQGIFNGCILNGVPLSQAKHFNKGSYIEFEATITDVSIFLNLSVYLGNPTLLSVR